MSSQSQHPKRCNCGCAPFAKEQTLANIEKHGWSMNAVFDPDRDDPPFVYTIGLEHSFEHPELIVVGMLPHQGGTLLTRLCELVSYGRRFAPGDICRARDIGCLSDLSIGRVASRQQANYLLSAKWLYNGNQFRSLQAIWPDCHGRFPDDPLFEPQFVKYQPLLT